MADIEKVIKGWERCEECRMHPFGTSQAYLDCEYTVGLYCGQDKLIWHTLEALKEQEALLREYEKLSQVCFKIEKYLKIADLSMLIDRIEEDKVEVLQDDGRPDYMGTTIKIRRK